MNSSYTHVLADYIASVSFSDLSAEVVTKARLLLLDYLGATAAGSNSPTAAMLQRALAQDLTVGPCWVIGREDLRVQPLMAALINGFNAHIVEYDDTHRNSLYHPGAPTIAAALATAQATAASGKKLIEGLVVGYEVGINLAEAINPAHYTYWHTTGTVGCFAAAAAASKIVGLSPQETVWALGNAGTQAAGLWEFQTDGAMTKPLHPGKAAMAGMLAVFLAREGFTGPAEILEGERGFCRATASKFDLSAVVPPAGRQPRLMEVTFKNYPSCGHTHTPIDAALELYKKLGGSVEQIAKIKVITNKVAARVAGNYNPTTAYEAKFSIPFCVAWALRYGSLNLDAFTVEALSNAQVRTLMAKIKLEIGQEMERVFQQKRPTEIIITLNDGRQVKARVEYRRGDPENPPTEDEIKAKYQMLAGQVLAPEQVEQWQAACERLLDYEDLTEFPA
ncbi:MAG: MmgE/PrpD family protein [Clostridia bacterium]|nr:MmgE/PrpD family protein [Clostridia bacterium]